MANTEQHKTTLEEMLEKVVAELSELGVQDPSTQDWVAVPESSGVDEADQNVNADTSEEWNERRAVLSQLETRYQNIVRALKKIEDGTFGTCEINGEPIEEERLAANPAARTCTAHMAEEESLPY